MKLSLTLFLTFFGAMVIAHAQSYSLTTSTGSYTELVGSTSLNGDMTWDDPEFPIPIGFDFTYYGQTVDTMFMSAAGLGGFLSPMEDNRGTFSLLVAYGADIIDRGWDFVEDDVTTGSLSTISYELQGAAGSQVLKIEWKNVGFYDELEDDSVSSDFTNFQVWLYEGSNQVEVHYGPNSITQPALSYQDQSGSFVAFFEAVDFGNEVLVGEAFALDGDPTAPQLVELTSIDTMFYLDGPIPDGTIYAFTKDVSSVSKNQQLPGFSLTPNPANDFFTISLSGDKANQDGQLEIVNVSGQTVNETRFTGQEIDISALSPGVYFVHLRIANRVGVKKLVVR
ncbi:MAG: T9SS type A sorting domain-containing protein [Saprospiraceae bacterium]